MAQDKIAGAVQWALNNLERRAWRFHNMQEYAMKLMGMLGGVATLTYADLADWDVQTPLCLKLDSDVEIRITGGDSAHNDFEVWYDDRYHDSVKFTNMPIDDVAARMSVLLATREIYPEADSP